MQRICKEVNITFYDGSIHLHTGRLCYRFTSDHITRGALRRSTFKTPFSSLTECSMPDNTFCNYFQVHMLQDRKSPTLELAYFFTFAMSGQNQASFANYFRIITCFGLGTKRDNFIIDSK